MFPVLFTIEIPAGWVKPVVVLLMLALLAGRAWVYRRQAAATGEKTTWGEALWDDKVAVLALVALAAALWRAGMLDEAVALPIHSYGLMLAAGFVGAVALAQREARRQGLDAEKVGDLAFWVLVAALVGSRLYFILVNREEYFGPGWLVETRFGRFPRALLPLEGGLVFYGGFIAAVAAAFVYMRRKGMPFLRYADAVIPSVALGHFLGRLGCFGAGCCWGRTSEAHLPWLVRFGPDSLAYQALAVRADAASFLEPGRATTLPLHPTQLYEAFGELAIFLALVFWLRPRRRFPGQILAVWLCAYAVLRTAVEVFRGDVERGVVAGLGVGQWTSAAILAAGAAVWLAGNRQAEAAAEPPRAD
jgi:phosphatidylglycerol:prolipoprotein diacylglycerol transferase